MQAFLLTKQRRSYWCDS